MIDEIWRDVPGLPYQVSDLGNVRSVDRTIADSVNRRRSFVGRRLTPRRAGREPSYLYVDLYHAGACVRYSIHQLVMMVFVGEPPPNHQVHHINRDQHDNRLVNLEYRRISEHLSEHHAGAGNPNAKLQVSEVRAIRRLHSQGVLVANLAVRFGVTESAIQHIVMGRNWRKVQP